MALSLPFVSFLFLLFRAVLCNFLQLSALMICGLIGSLPLEEQEQALKVGSKSLVITQEAAKFRYQAADRPPKVGRQAA